VGQTVVIGWIKRGMALGKNPSAAIWVGGEAKASCHQFLSNSF